MVLRRLERRSEPFGKAFFMYENNFFFETPDFHDKNLTWIE